MKLISRKNIYVLFLVVICLLSVVIVPTYAKFGYTDITDNDVVGMSLAFDVGITNVEEYEQIIVPANSSKKFNINIKNTDTSVIYYGVWYRMVDPAAKSSNILIGKLTDSAYSTSGSIAGCSGTGCSPTTVGVGIINNTDRNIILDIGVASSTNGINYIEYLDGKKLISGEVSIIGLNTVAVGSYVSYTGNNGCTGASCSGQNANYVDDTNMGYCSNSSEKFIVNGWRVGYIDDNDDDDDSNDNAVLISAGAPECMCTNSDGTTSSSSCSSYVSSDDVSLHLDNMNEIALKYCNSNYIKGNVCSNDVAYAFDGDDFTKIIGFLSLGSCVDESISSCGLGNDLIDIGSYFWFGKWGTANTFYIWNSSYKYISMYFSLQVGGIRPVLHIDSSVVVIGGEGTYDAPYIISKLANAS